MSNKEYKPKIKQIDDDPYGSFILEMGDGREFSLGERVRRYSSFAALDSIYGPFPVLEDDTIIPLKIAVENNAALATYLMLVYEVHYGMSWDDKLQQVADCLGVQKDTVRKYLRRVINRL
jgi:hypothetical protein